MRFPCVIVSLVTGFASVPPATADEPTTLPTYVVSVARVSQDATTLPIAVRTLDGDQLAAAPTLDSALRDDPAFSLFRRNTSLSANPTAHGVSLRGVGPSGASRTAVLLDDLPLNDPFGGWITWGQVPALSLAGAEIAHGGGSSTWGNAALGGTVALASSPLSATGGAASIQAGSDGFWRGEIAHTQSLGADSVRLNARLEDYDGFQPLPPEMRGAVDRPLDHTHRLGQLSWRHPFTSDTEARASVRVFDEDRGNGTALQQNQTRLAHAALAIEGRDGARPVWNLAAWAQRGDYSSFFTSVSSDRMQETPANDQFAVPATAAGLHASRIFRNDAATTVVGLDARWVEGETREDYFYRDGAFSQRRWAGGGQRTAGLFVHHDRPLAGPWHLTAGLRADTWANRDGHTREASLTTGAVTRDETHADRDGIELSPRLGVSALLARDIIVRTAVYRGFRQPTLNEYHRPFRVGTTSTQANPDLDPESLHGADLAIEQRFGPVHLSLGGFWNIMEDAVGNITLSSTPAGTTRQRQNIEETRVRGLEATVEWTPVPAIHLRAAAVVMDAEITEARTQPGLVGRRIAQVPDYAMTFAATWRATADTRVSAGLRACGRQFEDDENLLPLASACVIDLRLDHQVTPTIASFLSVENLLDHPAQTGRSTAGLVSYDQPRSVRAGLVWTW